MKCIKCLLFGRIISVSIKQSSIVLPVVMSVARGVLGS